jgi:hypothetical protein
MTVALPKLLYFGEADSRDCPSMIEHQVPQNEMWCCTRRNAILAHWIE